MIDEKTLAALLAEAGIQVPAARLPAILLQLERIEAIAAPLLAAPLDIEDEQAPVWRP